MTFNVADILSIDVDSSLGVINGKGIVSYVPGGEDVLKVVWRTRANVVAEGPGFIRADNLAAGKSRFVDGYALCKRRRLRVGDN